MSLMSDSLEEMRLEPSSEAAKPEPLGEVTAIAPEPVVATLDFLPRPLRLFANQRVRGATPHGRFGAPRYSCGKLNHYHQGVDVGADRGEEILAPCAGNIVHCNPGLGQITVKLVTTGGDALVLCDLGATRVVVGQSVRAGEVLALVSDEAFVHVAVHLAPDPHLFVDPTGMIAHLRL